MDDDEDEYQPEAPQTLIAEAAGSEAADFVLVLNVDGTMALWNHSQSPASVRSIIDHLEYAAKTLQERLDGVDMRVH